MITDTKNYVCKNSVLLDEYKKACEDEAAAIIALHDYRILPATQKEIMNQLSGQMETAHNKRIDIRSQLEAVRIDK